MNTTFLTAQQVQIKIDDKIYWINHCVDKLPLLTGNDKEYMYNHLTILREHLTILQSMKLIAQNSAHDSVSADRIYWEYEEMIDWHPPTDDELIAWEAV